MHFIHSEFDVMNSLGEKISFHWEGEVDSTNDFMKRIIKEEPDEAVDGLMVLTDYQTKGKGQRGNSWHSERGENLLFSLLIYPNNLLANQQFIISRIASLSVKSLLDLFVDDITIKWPNDIYWRDKKISGMLIENDLEGKYVKNSIIGIGINVNQESFPDDIPNPVSVRQIIGLPCDMENMEYIFTRNFTYYYYGLFEDGKIEEIEDEYMRSLYRGTGYHKYKDKDGEFVAKVEQILPSGHLVLKTLDSGEERKYAFKEVEFID
ncbi:MAG: biotin--[acetyl-CoA-carboxylase] ligase [Fermentimonas sp.]|jgi:BirA family biotin operon repressor/biotin-[acetyl-CoA-carboxylase] ligase